MITLIVCVRKKAILSREEFRRYWRTIHGPLVASVPEFTRHLMGYSQYYIAQNSPALYFPLGAFADYDGVASLKFHSEEDMAAALAEPRYLEIIKPDERNFIDLAARISILATEYRVI